MPNTTKPFLMDRNLRQLVASELWRIFGMECDAFTIAFDQGGVSIRIPFNSPVDLAGPQVLTGVVRSANDYQEFTVVGAHVPRE